MYSECDEVADSMRAGDTVPKFESFNEARQHVRASMPDETPQVIDNTAEALWLAQQDI